MQAANLNRSLDLLYSGQLPMPPLCIFPDFSRTPFKAKQCWKITSLGRYLIREKHYLHSNSHLRGTLWTMDNITQETSHSIKKTASEYIPVNGIWPDLVHKDKHLKKPNRQLLEPSIHGDKSIVILSQVIIIQ